MSLRDTFLYFNTDTTQMHRHQVECFFFYFFLKQVVIDENDVCNMYAGLMYLIRETIQSFLLKFSSEISDYLIRFFFSRAIVMELEIMNGLLV